MLSNNETTNNTLLLIGRILMGIIFVWAAFGKFMGYGGVMGYFGSLGIPVPAVTLPLTILVEVVFGLALIVGFQTRVAAAVLALFTIAATLYAHTKLGDRTQEIMFTKNMAIIGGFLALMVAGAGAWSLDGRKK